MRRFTKKEAAANLNIINVLNKNFLKIEYAQDNGRLMDVFRFYTLNFVKRMSFFLAIKYIKNIY